VPAAREARDLAPAKPFNVEPRQAAADGPNGAPVGRPSGGQEGLSHPDVSGGKKLSKNAKKKARRKSKRQTTEPTGDAEDPARAANEMSGTDENKHPAQLPAITTSPNQAQSALAESADKPAASRQQPGSAGSLDKKPVVSPADLSSQTDKQREDSAPSSPRSSSLKHPELESDQSDVPESHQETEREQDPAGPPAKDTGNAGLEKQTKNKLEKVAPALFAKQDKAQANGSHQAHGQPAGTEASELTIEPSSTPPDSPKGSPLQAERKVAFLDAGADTAERNSSGTADLEVVDVEAPEQPTKFFGYEPGKQAACYDFLVSVDELLKKAGKNAFQTWVNVSTHDNEAWTRRWAVVHHHALYLFAAVDSKTPLAIFILDEAEIRPSRAHQNALSITSQTGHLALLQAESREERNRIGRKLVSQTTHRRVGSPRKPAPAPQAVPRFSFDPSAMLWSVFLLVQVFMQLSVEVMQFLTQPGAKPAGGRPKVENRRPAEGRTASHRRQ